MASVGYNCVRQILPTACIFSSSCFPARSRCVQMQWLAAPSTLDTFLFLTVICSSYDRNMFSSIWSAPPLSWIVTLVILITGKWNRQIGTEYHRLMCPHLHRDISLSWHTWSRCCTQPVEHVPRWQGAGLQREKDSLDHWCLLLTHSQKWMNSVYLQIKNIHYVSMNMCIYIFMFYVCVAWWSVWTLCCLMTNKSPRTLCCTGMIETDVGCY